LAYSGWVIFLETPIFTRQIKALVDDDQYRQLQLRLLAHPDAGDLIPGSGGLRKVRMAVSGRGKRGGARIIYYWITAKSQIYMLLAYAKSEQDDLSEEQLKALRTLVRQEFG
jgi:mRNA-degrading endonuclease RelE of RelBE toxin-antitoxin system